MSEISVSSSKVEEIEFLQKVAKQCKSGSYLAGLFSEKMIEWVSEKINTDEIPDLFEYLYQSDYQLASEIQNFKIAEIALAEEKRQRVLEAEKSNALLEQRDNWKKQCEAEQTAGYNLSVELNNQIRDGQNEIDSLKSVVEDRDAQITALKAKLYDLLVK